MKKSLFALAAVTAFAGAAQAQSSVTVYGILDVGYVGGNNRGFTSTGASTKNTYNSFGSSAQSTSRLGFRGREDLGGGKAAFFTVEMAITPTDASGQLFGGTAASQNRQTFVGLSQKGLGQASIGTQYTPIHTAIGATSAGQQNNIVGDVVYPIAPGANGNVGAGTFGSGTAQLNAAGAASGNTGAYTVRTNNMLLLQSENVAGFVGRAFYSMADNNSTQTSATAGGENNKNGWGIGVNYNWKKLMLSANYQALKAVNPTPTSVINLTATAASVSSVAALNPNIWSGTAAASNIQDNQMYFAGMYDFGILKAYAQYINRKATSELDATQFLQRSAQQIGVRGNFTKTIEGWASVGNGRFDSFGTSAPTVNFTGYQLGSNYILSKRTNLYAIYGSTQQSSTSVATQPSTGMNQYALGVRHTF
jgi:predicted porin